MVKSIHSTLFSFDIEWIPDRCAGEHLCGIRQDSPASEMESFQALWKRGGASLENLQPYLKTVLCRIVTIAGILRETDPNTKEVSLRLISLPSDVKDREKWTEAHLIDSFLKAIGKKKPQLVAYNSTQADLPILIQRGIINGLHQPLFCQRPEKPWLGVDYFSNAGDFHIDLAKIVGSYGNTPSLDEIATLSGIPGKLDTKGDAVADLWMVGKLDKILQYNETDAFTTHLLWARIVHFAGLLNPDQYIKEQKLVAGLLDQGIAEGKNHFKNFRQKWSFKE